MNIDQNSPNVNTELASLLSRVQQGGPSAAGELCSLLTGGIRPMLRRRIGEQECEDAVQDVLIDVLTAIRDHRLRHPEAVIGFARTVALRKSAALITSLIAARNRSGESIHEVDVPADPSFEHPEETFLGTERQAVARRTLTLLKPREREILQRFYVAEQSPDRICAEMDLTPTQFRLLKSRAKARFGVIGRSIQQVPPQSTSRSFYRDPLPQCA